MSEKTILFSTEELKTKGDKARGVAKLGQYLAGKPGISKEIASDVSAHELAHALADPGGVNSQ